MIAAPVVLAAATVFAGIGSSADLGPGGGSLVLVDRTPGVVRQLTPGLTARWRVGVEADVWRLDAIDVRVGLPETSALDGYLTISVSGCTAQWVGSVCPATTIEVSPPIPAASWRGRSVPVVLPDRTVPRRFDLLVDVTLDLAAPPVVQGQVAQLRLEVAAAGEAAARGLTVGGSAADGATGGPSPANALPDTGFGLLGSLLTGVAAVAAGLLVAGLARLRRPVR